MTLTSKEVSSNRDEEICKKALTDVRGLTTQTALETNGPRRKTEFLLETYLRSKYAYDAMLIPEVDELKSIDAQEIGRLLQTVLKIKEKGITRRGQEK